MTPANTRLTPTLEQVLAAANSGCNAANSEPIVGNAF